MAKDRQSYIKGKYKAKGLVPPQYDAYENTRALIRAHDHKLIAEELANLDDHKDEEWAVPTFVGKVVQCPSCSTEFGVSIGIEQQW